jgi:hypothetical protein
VLTDFGTDVLSTSNDNGSFSTSWLRNLSAASNSWCSSSTESRKLHKNDFDSFYYHGQPSPIPTSALQLAGSTYLLRATAWEHYGRYVPASCYCQDLILVLALLLYISQLGYFHCLIGEWRVG